MSIHDNSSLETTMFTTYHHDAEPLDYTKVHLDNLNISLEFAQNHSCSCLPKGKSLFSTFSVSGRIYDLKKHVLPRLLKQSIVPDGTCVKISTCSGKVKRQIGRGKHGIVAILDNEKNCNSHIVIKTRSPTTSLAWEFDVLRKLEMRVRPHWKQQYPLPFPVEVSLILLADGAILGMKASSLSGFNLLSLANIYRRHGIVMPEILVLHYTSIMLHTLEVLHWHGKVLVSNNMCITDFFF